MSFAVKRTVRRPKEPVRQFSERRKRISKKGGLPQTFYLSCELVEGMMRLKERYLHESKIKVSKAYLVREAIREFLPRQNRLLTLAKKGEFHAKKREQLKLKVKR